MDEEGAPRTGGDQLAVPGRPAGSQFERWRAQRRGASWGVSVPSLEELQADRETVAESLAHPERRARTRSADDVPYLRRLPIRRAEALVSSRSRKRDAIFRRSLALADVIAAV
jgi:hypothetical protein